MTVPFGGLWLQVSSWQPWERLFRDAGFALFSRGWPTDADTVRGSRENGNLSDFLYVPLCIGPVKCDQLARHYFVRRGDYDVPSFCTVPNRTNGQMEVAILAPQHLGHWVRIAAAVLLGRTRVPRITTLRGSRISITSDRRHLWLLDGDVIELGDRLLLSVLVGGIRMCVGQPTQRLMSGQHELCRENAYDRRSCSPAHSPASPAWRTVGGGPVPG